MTDEEITRAILSVDENDELSKDMIEQVMHKLRSFSWSSQEVLRQRILLRCVSQMTMWHFQIEDFIDNVNAQQ